MKKTQLVISILTVLLTGHIFAQSGMGAIKKQAFVIGETVEMPSEILSENRTINIYLPNSYEDSPNKEYPVIYLLDGAVDEDFIHIAGLVQFGSFSWINMIPETIVVGIANVDRRRDFTFPEEKRKYERRYPTTGGSESFIRFIEQELQLFITENYRTNEMKTIIGQSLGGLLATEILYKKPDLFDNYIIISPSLWWDDESLLNIEPKAYTTDKQIYIGVGKEGKTMERVAKELYDKQQQLARSGAKLHFGFFEKQNHADVLHLSVYDSFEKIFKK